MRKREKNNMPIIQVGLWIFIGLLVLGLASRIVVFSYKRAIDSYEKEERDKGEG